MRTAATARGALLDGRRGAAVLNAAKGFCPQIAAFCALAIDTGVRRSELAGLRWTDIDLDAATLTIERQLDAAGEAPVFGPPKTKLARTVALDAETITRLRAHKRAQAELRMRNRTTYADFGLVFAKEHEDLQTATAALGQPIATLADTPFRRVVRTAGVKPIKFHGLRHTCATLLLTAGVPAHVVAQRLGHASPTMTLNVYARAAESASRRGGTARNAAGDGRIGNIANGQLTTEAEREGTRRDETIDEPAKTLRKTAHTVRAGTTQHDFPFA